MGVGIARPRRDDLAANALGLGVLPARIELAGHLDRLAGRHVDAAVLSLRDRFVERSARRRLAPGGARAPALGAVGGRAAPAPGFLAPLAGALLVLLLVMAFFYPEGPGK